jgi:O-antigen/teichoic acid export membrane protein
MTSRLERNAFANLAGTAWSIALGLACVPITMRLLGAEAFGLIGLYLTLQSIFIVLDLGITATLNREIARQDAIGDAQEQRDLVFTLQAIYWLAALVVGVSIVAIAPFVAKHWVKPDALSVKAVESCVRLMGIAFALQFPFGFYQSGLLGLQRHVLFNGLSVVLATVRAIGPLLLLWLVSPMPQLYFAAQIVTNAAGTGAIAILLWRCLPAGDGAVVAFRPAQIRRVWRFGAAYTSYSLANLALLQGDNVLLSALLPLETFGYYTLARRLASGLYALIIASNGAVFPHLSAAVARDDAPELARSYHRACQLMAVLLMPAAVVTAVFSREVLTMWTGDVTVVAHMHVVLTLVIIGMLIHGIAQGPIFLQIAHGRWRLISITNVILVVTMLPLYAVMAIRYGATGAAAARLVLNLSFLVTVPAVHRRFLNGELSAWLRDDVGRPLLAAVLAAAVVRWLLPPHLGRFALLVWILAAGALATVGTAASASRIRALIAPRLRRRLSPRIA